MIYILERFKEGKWKNLAMLSLSMGWVLCALWGKEFVMEQGFLEGSDIEKIIDIHIDMTGYFYFCFAKQMSCLVWIFFCCYKRHALIGLRVFVIVNSVLIGICLQVCTMRFGMLGIILWILLYIPHTIFYIIFYTLLIWLLTTTIKKNRLLYFGMFISFFMALYLESHTNVIWIQNFLEKVLF